MGELIKVNSVPVMLQHLSSEAAKPRMEDRNMSVSNEVNLDGIVRSQKMAFSVIPAKAGIQSFKQFCTSAGVYAEQSRRAGVTSTEAFCEYVNLDELVKSLQSRHPGGSRIVVRDRRRGPEPLEFPGFPGQAGE